MQTSAIKPSVDEPVMKSTQSPTLGPPVTPPPANAPQNPIVTGMPAALESEEVKKARVLEEASCASMTCGKCHSNMICRHTNSRVAQDRACLSSSLKNSFEEWHAVDEKVEDEQIYASGEARVVACSDGAKPVISLLISHELGQWLKASTELSQRHWYAQHAFNRTIAKLTPLRESALVTIASTTKSLCVFKS